MSTTVVTEYGPASCPCCGGSIPGSNCTCHVAGSGSRNAVLLNDMYITFTGNVGGFFNPACPCIGGPGSFGGAVSYPVTWDPARVANRFGVPVGFTGCWYYETAGCSGYTSFSIEVLCIGSAFACLVKWIRASDGQEFSSLSTVTGAIGTNGNTCYPIHITFPLGSFDTGSLELLPTNSCVMPSITGVLTA